MSKIEDDIDIDIGDEDIEDILEDEDDDIDEDDEESSSKSKTSKKRKAPTPTIKPHPPVAKLPYDDRIFIIEKPNNTNINNNNNNNSILNYEIITLPNPKYESIKCRYILDKENNRILEINKFNSKPSSWFIDNGVRNDGSLYLSSNIDPLFLLIPFLEKNKIQNKNEYFEISSIANDSHYRNLSIIPFKHSQLSLICDSKDIADSKLYRLDDSKLLIWLRCKVKNISNYLKETDTNIFKTSNYVKKELSWETLYTMSIGFISEYLSENNCKMLNQSFDLLSSTAKETIEKESEFLIYTEKSISEPEPSKPKRGAGKKSAASKKLASSPIKSGTSSITSFMATTETSTTTTTKKTTTTTTSPSKPKTTTSKKSAAAAATTTTTSFTLTSGGTKSIFSFFDKK